MRRCPAAWAAQHIGNALALTRRHAVLDVMQKERWPNAPSIWAAAEGAAESCAPRCRDSTCVSVHVAVGFNGDHSFLNRALCKRFFHSVRLIEVYDAQGQKVAQSLKNIEHYSYIQNIFDHIFLKDAIKLNVQHQGQFVGQVVLYGLAFGMLFMVFAVWWSVNLTYRHIMGSFSPIIQIAQLLRNQKAYNLRFPKSDVKEFQELNSVFNQLLDEIQSWHTHLQNENSELSYQVQHDHLTQLPNRSYFYQVLCSLFDDAHQRQNLALLFIDNNNFKAINDQYGHLVGDEVLKEMAVRLRRHIRQDDFVARLAGDEFAIILRSISKIEHLISIAENLIKCCEDPLIYKGQEIYFSFSLGIAISSKASSPEDLISQADQAMIVMIAKNIRLSILAFVCLALTGCMNLGGLSYKQARVLKKEGFVLTDEGWSLGLPERLLFGFNESNIQPEHQVELIRLAKQLNKYHLDKLKIVGHTDNVGNPEYNLKLSKERAQNVSDIFIAEKFNPANIQIIGKGSDQPLKSNDTEEHKAENRRVAVIIIP
ncbi:hypothetical protein FQR65_LT19226 [Abscondita terminalis]|nr:hypothetical protein FQR65_LT19226 [Abscondita terminalis]